MKSPRRPPGPRGLPFVGSLFEFRRNPPQFLLKLARDYGDIAAFRIGAQDACQLNHPDLIRDVLVTHSRNFRKTRGLDRAQRVIGKGLLTSENEFHRRQRRLSQPALHPQRIAAYAKVMTDYAAQMCDRWQDGESVDFSTVMLHLTLGIAGKTLFDADIRQDAKDIGDAMTEVFEYFNWLMLPLASLTTGLPLPRHRRFRQAKELLDRAIYRIISERRKTGDDRGDLLSMLLLARDQDGDGGNMTDVQVRDEIMTMFLAGHETVATALTWTYFLLAQHPEVESQMRAEVSSVLGDRVPTAMDVPKLKFTEMVLAESMRLYPPVWTLTRRAIDDYEVGPYVLRAGSVIGMSQYVMHHDPRYFPEPDRFDPLRWTPEEKAKRPKFSYFPFGGGPRLCIGEAFAWMEGTLVLATIARRWQVHLSPKLPKPAMFQPLITLRPKGSISIVVQRTGR